MALINSFFRPTYLPSIPSSCVGNDRRAGRRLVVRAAASTASTRQRRQQNVEGEFFVDHRCIDCDACRWMAPKIFTRVDGKSAVTQQPSLEEERVKALQALLSCPTSSIHTEKPTKEILEIQKMFPLPIDEKILHLELISIPELLYMPLRLCNFHKYFQFKAHTPELAEHCMNALADIFYGVYHCGYHSERSFGATSYLITHPEGNILVDSPRYTEKLAHNIEMLGEVRYMFLTHKDDIGDHEKWSKRLKCERLIHSEDVEDSTEEVEMKLYGDGPWSIGTAFDLIHTPGHTEGSVCLYYKSLKVLFTGDHLSKSGESGDLHIQLMYNKRSVTQQLDSVRKLLDLNFEWILAGHGGRIRFKDNQEKNSAIEELLVSHQHLYTR